MLLEKDLDASSRYTSFYDVDDGHFIEITHSISKEISRVALCNSKSRHTDIFEACGLVYLESVCWGEDNEYLDTDLLAAAEHCFTEIKHEA